MNRREFIQKTGLALTLVAAFPGLAGHKEKPQAGKVLSAYYFRAHMYTIVPRHVREDMKWMAGIGTQNVCVAILEQDMVAAVENVAMVKEEAAREGMNLFIVPSRWGGLLAGAPKVPSLFTVTHPQSWMQKKDGSFYSDPNVGVHSSIHDIETFDFFRQSLDTVIRTWAPAGIIWDEPKIYGKKDYSAYARAKINDIESQAEHNDAFSSFFSKLNIYLKAKHSGISTHLFVYANMPQSVIDSASRIEGLDFLGCDGRAWRVEDGGKVEQESKVLLGPGERFIKAAKANGLKSLFLIENHNMNYPDIQLMDKRLPEVFEIKPDHLIYYYYPRNVDRPDENMNVLAKHLKKYR